MSKKIKTTVTAIFPGIGPVEITKERADQIRRLQRIIRDGEQKLAGKKLN
jgi:hypothetical protein